MRNLFNLLVCSALLGLWPVLGVAQDGEIVGEQVQLSTDMGDLHGTLLIPETEKAPPVVFIHPGSGPTDRDGNNPMMKNNSLKYLAEALYRQGIASLRIDKRGIAESADVGPGSEADLRFEHYVNDAADWMTWLGERENLGSVIALGHSEGSLITMLASQKADVAGYISLAGPGRPADQILRDQLAAQGPSLTEMTDPILDFLLAGKTVEDVNPMLASLFRPSVQPYLISWFKYDPAAAVKKLDFPILIINGTTDIQVPASEAEILAEAASSAELVIIEGMNHILKEAPADRMANIATYSDPELPLIEELVASITAYVNSIGQ